jgi:hypothetical protein
MVMVIELLKERRSFSSSVVQADGALEASSRVDRTNENGRALITSEIARARALQRECNSGFRKLLQTKQRRT